MSESNGPLYELFADLLEYPSPAIFRQTEVCIEQLQPVQLEAADLLDRFHRNVKTLTLEQLEELYTSTFDMQPVCYPYVGYQLFGESYKRGAFMARLNGHYHSLGYFSGKELPDHVAVVLRFLSLDAVKKEDDFCQTLLYEGLLPALGKMSETLEKLAGNPYAILISALLLVLTEEMEKEMGNA